MRPPSLAQAGLLFALILFFISCKEPARPGLRTGTPVNDQKLCGCKPSNVSKDDWRITIKNVPLPADANPTDVTVKEILAWRQTTTPISSAPRSDAELRVYRIRKAYLQSTFLQEGDCDFHVEISEEPGKNAPRMIVETPGMKEFCPARLKLLAQLRQTGFTLTNLNQELAHPLPVEVIGLGFHDRWHAFWIPRGSSKVATLWELHPAVVKLLQ